MKKHSCPKQNDEKPPAHDFLTSPCEMKSEDMEFPLGENTYITRYFKEIYILRKGSELIRIHETKLRLLLDMKMIVDYCLQNDMQEKQVRLVHHLGDGLYIIVQSPYQYVDLRQFWVLPNTGELFPTEIGILLTFTEYKELINVLEKTKDEVITIDD